VWDGATCEVSVRVVAEASQAVSSKEKKLKEEEEEESKGEEADGSKAASVVGLVLSVKVASCWFARREQAALPGVFSPHGVAEAGASSGREHYMISERPLRALIILNIDCRLAVSLYTRSYATHPPKP